MKQSLTVLIATLFVVLVLHQVASSGLNGFCEVDDQCGTFDTICVNSTCVCKGDFAVAFDTCVQFVEPSVGCQLKNDCKKTLTRAVCKDKKCACKSFHHFLNGQCIKSRSLGEECDTESQCYCGQSCQPNIECSPQRICQCKFGFQRQGRRCIRSASVDPIQSITSVDNKVDVDLKNQTTTEKIEEETTTILKKASKSTKIISSVAIVFFVSLNSVFL